MMSGMSGREVAEPLRKDRAVSHALIVAISGYDEDGVPPGFDHLMVKPVDHGALLKLISAYPGRTDAPLLSLVDSRVVAREAVNKSIPDDGSRITNECLV
jgi:CheY-like chemotaxis protein